MADTTATSSDTNCVDKLKSYVTTQRGAILAGEIVLTLIIIICHALSRFLVYSSIAICEMIIAIVFFVVFIMELDKQFTMVNWLWSDFLRAISGAAVLLIISLEMLFKRAGDEAWVAAGVVGVFAGLLFAYDTYTIFLHIKSTRQNTSASTDDQAPLVEAKKNKNEC